MEFSDNHGSTASTEDVIHDLAIAKPAMQIQMQATESSTYMYDNIFITFGTFHISMAYFTLLGSLIDWSGGKVVFWHLDPLMVSSKENTTTGK